MKAEELRIGNYLDRNGLMEVCKIDGMSHVGKVRIYDHVNKVYIQHTFDLDSFKPIPLTEEWLLKFGFECWDECNEDGYAVWVLHNVIDGTSNFEVSLKDGKAYPSIDENCIYWGKEFHVHQLQNLIFALTGTELQITK